MKKQNKQNRHGKAAAKPTPPSKKVSSKRRGDYKEHLKEPFLKAFRDTGTILHASLNLDIDRNTILNWREKDPNFNLRFMEADAEVTEKIEAPALRRCVNGKPVYWIRNGQPVLGENGQPILLDTEYPEDLVKFMLSRRNRKKYGEKIEVEVTGEFAQRFASEIVAIIRRKVPSSCPHCNNNLAIAPEIAKELETLSAKMNTP